MKEIKSVLITGANSGLGFECARQMAGQGKVDKIYLACRNQRKAREAKAKLEQTTGRSIFEIVILDVMDHASIRKAISSLTDPIDVVILNAGGVGGKTPNAKTADGVTHIFAVNVLGHAVLVDEMMSGKNKPSVVLYAGSEAARGIAKMGIARPDLAEATEEVFASVAEGTKFPPDVDSLEAYGEVKLTATLWMSSMARMHPEVRFVTVSPGGTTGTKGMDDLPFLKKVFFKYVGGLLMPLFGMMHSVQTGAKRYVDAINDGNFRSGRFYASKSEIPTGPVVDQADHYTGFDNPAIQDNARKAIYRFI